MNSRKYDTGDVIYRRGDAAASAFELREGKVRLTWPGPAGIEMTTILGVGQILGAAELIGGGARPATAEAASDVVMSEIRRDEFIRLCATDAEFAKAMLQPAFERLRQDTESDHGGLRAEPAATASVVVLSQLLLRPAARELAQQMDSDGVRIATLPFRIGRKSSRPLEGDDSSVELALYDTRPYSLSRRHFAVETRNGGYVVRDCGSHHGTIVNGARIGGELAVSVAPLIAGENRIVAGRALSPFRFTLTIEGA
jgi:CRP-like cAMP-binding protein